MKKTRIKHTAPSATLPVMKVTVASLASGMADDFNNILTTVMGACSLIDKDDPANSELLQCVELIRASAEHAADLSDKLMRAGRLDQENTRLDSDTLDSADTSGGDKKTIHDIVTTSKHPDGASS